ncbi:8-amino-7-oxononanoate synthase [Candidatus Protochlamydia naegleriophila]|uniref:8-amino-7-oxononanoate synthase n=1 Tax=Candidatus Protochlamydia naegleriophila TaxID=389348 RepID=A0A0U5ET37_9BACT|nr:aminotransferase class I/II-fold pyridoxal phosphate-dependent enzyme [Candidatus Protochlamydia naegleriophila]CUI17392.1 8-amino-7-oxononanoate synthase [Candidatus Protochlamydia naegleriophila]
MLKEVERRLAERERKGCMRQLILRPGLIDFASNDYLGLARSPRLEREVLKEWKGAEPLNRLGSTGSRLLTGHSLYAEELEAKVAAFHGYEAGLLFTCGYMANMGLLSAVAGSGDAIFYDAHIHASIRDGMRLSLASCYPFKHQHAEHLEQRLKTCSVKGNRFICIESVYSTDGSQAPLVDLCLLAKKYGAHLIVDEAHAVGMLGPEGKGLVAAYQLAESVFAHVVTFGKAVGTHGAMVLGSHLLKKSLINFARSAIYTTALPFHSLAAIKCSYDLFPTYANERHHVRELAQLFVDARLASNLSAIQSIRIEGNEKVLRAMNWLEIEGFDVRALMSPTVQRGRECLRICLHAFNTKQEALRLIESLQRILTC